MAFLQTYDRLCRKENITAQEIEINETNTEAGEANGIRMLISQDNNIHKQEQEQDN